MSPAASETWLFTLFHVSILTACASLCMLLVEHRRRTSQAVGQAPPHPSLWIVGLAMGGWTVDGAVGAIRLEPPIATMLVSEACVLAVVAIGLRATRSANDHTAGRRLRRAGQNAGPFWAVLACSSDGLLGFDLDGRVTVWNRAAEELLGWKAFEAIGRSDLWSPPPQRAREEKAVLERMRRGGKLERYETELKRRGGGAINVAVTVSPIFSGSGSVIGVVRAVQDLTLAEDRHERLRRRQAELAHLSRIRAMNDLSAAVAHEISQPLAAIGNLLGVARSVLASGARNPDPNGLPAAARVVDLASEQAVRAGEIISHVRAFVARGDADLRAERLDQLVEAALSLALLADGSQTLLHKSLAPNLLVWADRVQIEQVVVNLVKNALEAMSNQPASTRKLTVTAGPSADPAFAEVCVVDTGPGLPTAGDPKAPVSNKPKGLGIGLAISRRIIVAHGGRLTGRSCTVGAHFRFTIPLATGDLASAR
jgi:two-component system sensor kinase FixL